FIHFNMKFLLSQPFATCQHSHFKKLKLSGANFNGIIGTAANPKSIVVKCHTDSMEVVIKTYLIDPGWPVEPTHFRLGPFSAAQDQCRSTESRNRDYVIRSPLSPTMLCCYNNLLLYSPPLLLKQCVIRKLSSRTLKPTWTSFISIHSALLDLDFHLRLMRSDWSSERKSSVCFLAEMVNMEASVDHHLPLRLYVNSCVATLSSDAASYPRYPFVDHQGCFTDPKVNGSSSRFLTRIQDNLLQIQLQPFLFHQDPRHIIYITCYLEAVPISVKDLEKRACSFMSRRWGSADGDDHVCEEPIRAAVPSPTTREQLTRETSLRPLVFLPKKLPM
uniref:Zona pellucida sperm-binding protein 3 n=1 Tax=Mastacembelus armatus TaxID=205130 RepID=A0A3Q3RJW2_9TELE